MFEESSVSFKDNYNEQSYTLLPSISNTFLDQNLSEIHLHDEESFSHLSISYMNQTLNFMLLSFIKSSGQPFSSLRVQPIKISNDQLQIIEAECNNFPVKKLKMISLNKVQQGMDQIDENTEPVSPTFAQLGSNINSQIIAKIQSYIAVLILEQEIISISFNVTSNQNNNELCHELTNFRVKKIRFEGIVSQVFLNREREQMICCIQYESQSKVILVDQIFERSLIKDLTHFQTDAEKIIGEIGVNQEFTLVRIVTRLEKERRFFINTYHISMIGSSLPSFNQENIQLKIHFNKRPLCSMLNDNNFNNCSTIFSQSSSYLTIQDTSSIEIQDFNNHNVKNIIKEFSTIQKQQQPKSNQNSNSCTKSTINQCSQAIYQPTKQIYNLNKSTLVVANSSVNQCISFYNIDNPISVLEQINSLGSSEQKNIKRIIISQNIQKLQTPCSASNLMEMFTYLKQSTYFNLILMIVLHDNETITPILIDKEILEQKLPELKFVSSQITNIYNQEDTMSQYNDFDPNFNRTQRNFDVFKTPDRKASINLITSLDNNKFNSQNNNINQIQFGSAINPSNFCQSQEIPSLTNINYFSSQRQGCGLNFDSQNANIQIDRCFSQESSRHIVPHKPPIMNYKFNNNRLLFNENSNSVCIEDISQQSQKQISLQREKENSYLFDKISPTQQKIEETMNSSDSEGYSNFKYKVEDFDPASPLLSQIKHQNRFRYQHGGMRHKDVSRITMKTIPENFSSQIFQKTEVSQEDIIEIKQKNNSSDSQNRVTIVIDSQTQDDIESSFIPQQTSSFSNEDRSTASKVSSNIFSSSISKFEKNKDKSFVNSNILDSFGTFKTNELDNDEIYNILSEEMSFNQFEYEESQNVKKNNQKRNNNIFNNKINNQTSLLGKKSNQQNHCSSQKAISSFLTISPTPKTSEFESNDWFLKNNQKLQSQQSSSQQLIKPFNSAQTKHFQNDKNKCLSSNNIIFNDEKQLLEEEKLQIQNNQQNYYHNRFKQQNNFKQSQLLVSSKDIQTLLCKRKQSQQQKQQSLLSSFNIEPIKMIHKSD